MTAKERKHSLNDHLPFLAVFALAVVLRFYELSSYVPLYWDEAKYLTEVEGIGKLFSVNVGSFAFLKLARFLFGGLAYPQVIGAIFGLISIVGLYWIGTRLFGPICGLFVAAQAAMIPYVLKFSRSALSENFALTFFVLTLCLYVMRAAAIDQRAHRFRFRYGMATIVTGFAYSLVSACSFKFLQPAILSFVIAELQIWLAERRTTRSVRPTWQFVASVLVGVSLFVISPLVLSFISGYDGWLNRAMELSQYHINIHSFQWATHFLIPIHIFYLCGTIFLLLSMVGLASILYEQFRGRFGTSCTPISILLSTFWVYLLYFGLFSHLQGARVYLLTLPILIICSSFVIIRLSRLQQRFGIWASYAIAALLFASLAYQSYDYLRANSGLKPASDAIAKRLLPMGQVYSNAKDQFNYCIFRSPLRQNYFGTNSYRYSFPTNTANNDTIIVVVNEASDVVAFAASWDKAEHLTSADSIKMMIGMARQMTLGKKLVYSGPDKFFGTPYYYLEDVYSWDSYLLMRELLAICRDSIYVLQ